MRKALALAMAAVMSLGLMTGCGAKEDPAGSAAASSPVASTPNAQELNVGVFYYDFSDIYISTVRTIQICRRFRIWRLLKRRLRIWRRPVCR